MHVYTVYAHILCKYTETRFLLLSLQVLSPTYKQRNEDFRKLFKQLPDTERLIVGESKPQQQNKHEKYSKVLISCSLLYC